MACLPKLKCFKKEDGSDVQKPNNAKAAAAAVPNVPGRHTEAQMDHCAKWLMKVSAVTEYEESNLHSPKYMPPSSYLNNVNSNGKNSSLPYRESSLSWPLVMLIASYNYLLAVVHYRITCIL